MNITRNRQQVTFSTDHVDADIVQTSQFLNSAGLPLPLNDYLINGVHVVASTGPLARQAIRENAAQADETSADAAPVAKSDAYTPPATWHPGRCYCGRFGGGHIPGLLAPIRSDKACEGDRVRPHDESSCGACLAGATDFRPAIEAGQTWISNQYNTDHQVIAEQSDGTWWMEGPVGNRYAISDAGLYSRYTLDLDR